jgi:hypothetical protein
MLEERFALPRKFVIEKLAVDTVVCECEVAASWYRLASPQDFCRLGAVTPTDGAASVPAEVWEQQLGYPFFSDRDPDFRHRLR